MNIVDYRNYFNEKTPVCLTNFEKLLIGFPKPYKIIIEQKDYEEITSIYKKLHNKTISGFLNEVMNYEPEIEVV